MTLKVAKKLLLHEANSIVRMTSLMDAKFTRAVNVIYSSKGPVILIGMGKPSFVAQKISASMASTGTNSFTLHPADALHGDLGRVTSQSVVILLSNSGETEEIIKLLPLLKSIGSKTIALAGNIKSTLASSCDIALNVSVEKESEPLNAAPTASTTCMLAMGDALTMALVHKRKFKEKDFAKLHPGGSLGKRLRITVGDVMRKGKANPCVLLGTSVKTALLKITTARAGSVTVVNKQNKPVGIFTDGDLRRHLNELSQLGQLKIEKVMTKKPMSLHENLLVFKAMELFRRRKIDEAPVVDSAGCVTGLLDIQDLLARGFVHQS
ncbi:MAG: arabinose-5-phosphate isomerase [Candidatus Omnitrophota bacterium]|jgi:arabinose-5-phosphate isomerase